MATNNKMPQYIRIKTFQENDPDYPEINITDKARIPVIPLDYNQRDIAKNKELLLDYKGGGLYVVDAEDRTIIHDLTKMIADNYLNQINGDNTYVNIEGLGLVNLAYILKILHDSRVELLNTSADDAMGIPAGITYDSKSIIVANNKVEVYGFHNAKPLATPRISEDGSHIEWVGGVEEVRPGGDIDKVDEPPGGFEPPLGAKQNVLYIYPNQGVIILYNKPQQFTPIKTADDPSYEIRFPLTIMQYSKFFWRLDADEAFEIQWPNNLIWLNKKPERTRSENVWIFECTTWDYGNTWIIKYINYEYTDYNIKPNLDPDKIYLTDEQGNLLTNMGELSIYTTEDDTDVENKEVYINLLRDEYKVKADGEPTNKE